MPEHPPLLRDLVVLVAIAIPVVMLMTRLKVPTLVGFLLTGIAIGPTALGLIHETKSVQELAEIGAVLLLFAVGLELSLSRILRMGALVLRGGASQMLVTIVIVALLLMAFGAPMNGAVLGGALVALSSTAIILKIYADSGELDSPQGKVAVAILLFQDLCVVPLMVALPLLAGTQQGMGPALRTIGLALVVVAAILVAGRWFLPRLLERVVALRNQEIFTLCVLAVGLGAAYVTSAFGLSLALGAFLAGLIIAESEFGLQALSDVLPFRDTFSGLFFTSVGMLLDLRYVVQHLPLVLGAALGIVVVKTLVTYVVVRIVRRSTRVALLSALSLAQVGEFSFVLASVAGTLGLLTDEPYQLFLGASVITMIAAPFLVASAPAIVDQLLRRRVMPTMEWATREVRAARPLTDHAIIVGYGLNGQNLARTLSRARIQYAILEGNSQLVRRARLEREPIFFGDGTRAEVLERVGIKRARVIVFAIASLADQRRGVAVARQLNPHVYIVCRTRSVSAIAELGELGANEVVPEEFETSIEIFGLVLHRYGVPEVKIREAAEDARSAHYAILRERGVESHREMLAIHREITAKES